MKGEAVVEHLIGRAELAFSDGMEKFLLEDVQHSLRMRLFKAGRTGWEEATIKGALKALGTGSKELKTFEEAMARLDAVYFTMMRTKTFTSVSLKEFENAIAEFRSVAAQIRKSSNKQELEDLLVWTERELAERSHCVEARSGKSAPPKPIKLKDVKPLASTEMIVLKESRSRRAALLYEAYIDSLSSAKDVELGPLWRINDYFAHDDPLWERLVDVMDESGHLSEEQLSPRVQGVLGEAFALRHKEVVAIVEAEFKRAQRLADKLGSGWEVKVVEGHVMAGSPKPKARSLGELYDGSVWVVNPKEIGKSGQPVAAPVWVLSVKSGKSVEAALQNTKETLREFGQTMVFPAPKGAAPSEAFEIMPLQQLLSERDIEKVAGTSEELSTHRLLVAPIPPSEGRAAKDLGAHVGVQFWPSILSKREMNNASMGLSRQMKQAVQNAKKVGAWR